MDVSSASDTGEGGLDIRELHIASRERVTDFLADAGEPRLGPAAIARNQAACDAMLELVGQTRPKIALNGDLGTPERGACWPVGNRHAA